jgi:hypothetical protein
MYRHGGNAVERARQRIDLVVWWLVRILLASSKPLVWITQHDAAPASFGQQFERVAQPLIVERFVPARKRHRRCPLCDM